MDSLYDKLISEAEKELKELTARNAELKRKLAGEGESETLPSSLEGEISSLIMMSHMENTKQVYRFMEELKREEEERERVLEEKLAAKRKFKQRLLETIETTRSQMIEL